MGFIPARQARKKMLTNKKIGFIGAGNMGEALIKGLIGTGAIDAGQITASDIREDRLSHMKQTYGVGMVQDNSEVVRRSDIVVLSVKPQIMNRVLEEIAGVVSPTHLVVSIAAGVPIEAMEAALHKEARVVRVMPNTPALVGAGTAALAAGAHATEEDLDLARAIFDSVGLSFVIDESLLDAVTGLSGSGPAYVFLIIEALSDAGVKVGLSRHMAQPMAANTVLGSAKLLLDTGEHPGLLKDMVTSPGGTAIAGLHTLEAGGLRTTLINAVEEATRRSRELGEIMIKKLNEERGGK